MVRASAASVQAPMSSNDDLSSNTAETDYPLYQELPNESANPHYAALLESIEGFGSYRAEYEQTASYEGTVIYEEHYEQQPTASSSGPDAFRDPSEQSLPVDRLDILKEDWARGKEALDKSHQLHKLGSGRKRVVSELQTVMTSAFQKHLPECSGGSAFREMYSVMFKLMDQIKDFDDEYDELSEVQVGLNYAIAERHAELYASFAGGIRPDASDTSLDNIALREKAEESIPIKELRNCTSQEVIEDVPCMDPDSEHLGYILQSSLRMRKGDDDDDQCTSAVFDTSFYDTEILVPVAPRSCAKLLPGCGKQFTQGSSHSGKVRAKYDQLLKPSPAMKEVRRQDLDHVLGLDFMEQEPLVTCFGSISDIADSHSLYLVKTSEDLAQESAIVPGGRISMWVAGMSQNTWTEVQRYLQHDKSGRSGGHLFVSNGPGGNMFQFVRDVINEDCLEHNRPSAGRVVRVADRASISFQPTRGASAVESIR